MPNKNFLGVGWNFPIGVDRRRGLAMSRFEENIEQAVRIILGTAFGERVMRPDFGCGIHDYVFAPNNTITQGLVEEEVRDALRKWEPRIREIEVDVGSDLASPNRLDVKLKYVVHSTNSVANLVYPFYLTGS